MNDPVEVPADDLDDPVAINDVVLIGRERERLRMEREIVEDVRRRAET